MSPTPFPAVCAGRLRTDLGGLFFNLTIILALAGLYAATNAEILLLAIAVIQLEMALYWTAQGQFSAR